MSFHSATSWWRSAGARSGRRESGSSGSRSRSSAAPRRSVAKWARSRSAVAAWKRSAAYSSSRSRPRSPPSPTGAPAGSPPISVAASERSSFAVVRSPDGRRARRRPPAERALREAGAPQRQHRLDEGGARQVALRPQVLDQGLEGEVLVGEGGERRLARRGQQAAEPRIARQPRPQDQRVDEEADQPLELRPRAVRDRRADEEVLLAAVARQGGREGREEEHVERRPFAPRRLAEARRLRRREEPAAAGAAEALHRRARPVGRQLEGERRRGELPAPVGELTAEHLGRPVLLPGREVGILEGRLGKGRRPPGERRPVERRELGQEHPLGPAVVDGVMEGEEEGVLRGAQAGEPGAHERPPREVERPFPLLVAEAPELGAPALRRQGA